MEHGDFTPAMRLINSGTHPDAIISPHGSSALTICISSNNAAMAIRFLKMDANPNHPVGVTSENTYLGQCLAKTTHPGMYQPIISALLQHGADPNIPCDADGSRPLHLCFRFGLAGAAKLLIDSGADPFLTNKHGANSFSLMMAQPLFLRWALFFTLLNQPNPTVMLDRLLGESCISSSRHTTHLLSNLHVL
jgi:ankyrin repeat protein